MWQRGKKNSCGKKEVRRWREIKRAKARDKSLAESNDRNNDKRLQENKSNINI